MSNPIEKMKHRSSIMTKTPLTDAAETKARIIYLCMREAGDCAFDTAGYDFARTLELKLAKYKDSVKEQTKQQMRDIEHLKHVEESEALFVYKYMKAMRDYL